jgi:hypothetical protein
MTMKRFATIAATVVGLALAMSGEDAHARDGGGGYSGGGGGHSGGGGGYSHSSGHYGGHYGGSYGYRGWYGGVYVGGPWYWGWPYYGGYPYYPYAPYSAATYESAPSIYVEPAAGGSAPANAEAAPQNLWYYCSNPSGYYPYVKTCVDLWVAVVPTPQGGK